MASRGATALLVEVKGFPSTAYARGERAGRPKRTARTLQAKQWFAGLLPQAVRLRHARTDAAVAIALPTDARYASLLAETSWALAALRIRVLAVDADGRVHGLADL